MTAPGMLGQVAAYLGSSEAAFRLLLTILSGYPLALIHRNFLLGKSPKHSTSTLLPVAWCSAASTMGYLVLGYYHTATKDYDITWTMPHCILSLRLIEALAWHACFDDASAR
ncbi:hypothetical protein HPB52_024905 [Rhipicephalus sanguineus]|uniref:Uncharacterized protein n=1 Tax=Rhipicephalus sanguineus TaxID=34632 RepID=A0A9D4TDS2_RHISA|nr:hypothetical protein HPB52_024905 [Rhipicephalus sanguineus]